MNSRRSRPVARRALARRALMVGAMVILLAPLISCGKRGSLEPPEGRESQFTYPKAYPAQIKAPPTAEAATEEEEEASTLLPRGPVTATPATRTNNPFPSPLDRTRTTTYGPQPVE